MGLPKRRPSGTPQTATAPVAPSITLGEGLPDAPVTFMAGDYKVTIKEAVSRVSKKGTVNLILTCVEAETGSTVNLPPLWMGGGNVTNAPTLVENHQVVGYLAEAVGAKPKGMTLDKIAAKLVGLECWVEIGSDQINGRDCNRLLNACSVADYEAG